MIFIAKYFICFLEYPSSWQQSLADVTSLYTNIPHNEGLSACQTALNTCAHQSPPTQDLIRLLDLILTLNDFQFNGNHYLQTKGTAMGTPVATSYANIFMGSFEQKMFLQNNGILPGS